MCGSPSTRSALRAASAAGEPRGTPFGVGQSEPDPGEAGRRRHQPLLGEPAALERLDDRGSWTGHERQVVPEADRVDAGLERAHRRLLGSDERGDRAHLDRVADDRALEPELLAEEPHRGRVDRRGVVAELGHDHVRGHHRGDARGDRGAERSQMGGEVACRRRAARGASPRSCRRARGSAWRRRRRPRSAALATNAATCRPTSSGSEPNERTPITGLSGLVFTSATGAKSRLTPTCASSAPIAAATERVSSTSSTTPSARWPGVRAAGRRLEPRDVAALLVGRDQDPGSRARPVAPSAGRAGRDRGCSCRTERRRRARARSSAAGCPVPHARRSPAAGKRRRGVRGVIRGRRRR